MRYDIIGTVGSNGCGVGIHESVFGNEIDFQRKMEEIKKEYGSEFISLSIFEDDIKVFDSKWK